ncbi:MAG: signal peptide peptidase SppA [Candidatus Calescibacterium sp.]|nr:signal peptide peptidase SppA [Candidatus Calescibacterium sp.]MDW8086844.1 signal peptide peptidase SppA [Candidatus Calescibacterium sp.]
MRFLRKFRWILYIIVVILVLRGIASFFKDSEEGKESIYIMNLRDTIVFSEPFVRELRSLEKRESIKAVVIRINSPGGAIGASQEIFQEIEKFKEKTKKKIICSIENVGASGAYYVSLSCDKVIALPGSIVGSIGVISIFFTADELLDKAKIKPFIVKSGSFKDTGTPFRKPTESDIKYLQSVVDELFEQFKQDVITKRPNLSAKIDEIADGRIFSGREAQKLGLIDYIGTFSDAITIAKELAGIKTEPKIIWQQKRKIDLLEEILGIKEIISKILTPIFM